MYIYIYVCVYILGASEITENLYCNWVHLYWEGCVYIFAVTYETLCIYISNILRPEFSNDKNNFMILHVCTSDTHHDEMSVQAYIYLLKPPVLQFNLQQRRTINTSNC